LIEAEKVVADQVFWVNNRERQLNTQGSATMFRISRFAEVLKHLPRGVFDRAVQEQQGDRYRKSFDCWQQLVTMMYAQLSGASSLRVLASGFNAQSGHHYHLGCKALKRSTLADMNAKGSVSVFAAVANALMQCVPVALRSEAAPLVRLLDSSSITLKGPGFDTWTHDTRTRHTQGMKLHVLLGLNEQAPLSQALTAPNINDIEHARTLPLESGVIYVFDKGYCDYTWWWRIQTSGARFVTRFKRNANLTVLKARPIAQAAKDVILKDELVQFGNKHPRGGRRNLYTAPLRRIEVARENAVPLVLATNDLKSSALHIAERYKARWHIELFFKWIKQHLRIKRFLGRSESAVRIQILTALIAYLLLALYSKANGIKQSLWLLLSELRSTLFQRADAELYRHRRWRRHRVLFQSRQTELFA
jgi:putative transposase